MTRHLIGGTVTMQWPHVSVTVDLDTQANADFTPSQWQAECVYRALCKARSEFNAPDEFPTDIRVDTTWAETWQ